MKPQSPGLPALIAYSGIVLFLLSGCPLSNPELNLTECTSSKDCFTDEGETCEISSGKSTGVCKAQFKDGSVKDYRIPTFPDAAPDDAAMSDGLSDGPAGDSDGLGDGDGAMTGDGTIHQPESGTDATAADAK